MLKSMLACLTALTALTGNNPNQNVFHYWRAERIAELGRSLKTTSILNAPGWHTFGGFESSFSIFIHPDRLQSYQLLRAIIYRNQFLRRQRPSALTQWLDNFDTNAAKSGLRPWRASRDRSHDLGPSRIEVTDQDSSPRFWNRSAGPIPQSLMAVTRPVYTRELMLQTLRAAVPKVMAFLPVPENPHFLSANADMYVATQADRLFAIYPQVASAIEEIIFIDRLNPNAKLRNLQGALDLADLEYGYQVVSGPDHPEQALFIMIRQLTVIAQMILDSASDVSADGSVTVHQSQIGQLLEI